MFYIITANNFDLKQAEEMLSEVSSKINMAYSLNYCNTVNVSDVL